MMGVPLMLFAFIATVIGGMGSLVGAVVGGFAVGFVSVMLQAYLPEDLRSFRDAFVFNRRHRGAALPAARPDSGPKLWSSAYEVAFMNDGLLKAPRARMVAGRVARPGAGADPWRSSANWAATRRA